MRSNLLVETVFGEVVVRLLEARDLPVIPSRVGKLAEDAGLDGWDFIGRMADPDADWPGYLDGLADVLELSEDEKVELALAYSMERRLEDVRARRSAALPLSAVNETLTGACEILQDVPDEALDGEGCRVMGLIAEAGGIVAGLEHRRDAERPA